MNWIKCSDRIPEGESFVLVTNGKHVGVGAYRTGEHIEYDERWQDEHGEFIDLQSKYPVTHWQPLPQPPQPSTKDNDSWIEWIGGERPNTLGKSVIIRLRDGSECKDVGFKWYHDGHKDDVVAYRVIENDGREG